MTPPADGPGRRRTRWWSPLLLVHAAVVVALLLVTQLEAAPATAPTDGPGLVRGLVTALVVMLGAPWWLLLWGVPTWVPLIGDLVLHLGLLRAFGQREKTGGPRRRPESRSLQFALSVVAGALVWACWLGWDTTASYDVVTRQVESPYVTLQVLGCAVTVGVVTALLGARWWWAAAAGGVSVGFWLGWTTQAAATDTTGLYLIGSLLLAAGLAAGTSFAAFVGRVLARARRERASA
ncbi:hypothetical protein [Quadrisphaera setariae]|uniref:Uncharacterized protein n=1 Tax=Quadrisphaera setariae TaxID=2593304 RepID=A0A5C8ZJX1_9ACTN|nr:hypothetical protein [Quadrisphaera setariae]TXR57423.1 hypothetical protein FMM08_04005 [Quadrisphaera setariae]